MRLYVQNDAVIELLYFSFMSIADRFVPGGEDCQDDKLSTYPTQHQENIVSVPLQ